MNSTDDLHASLLHQQTILSNAFCANVMSVIVLTCSSSKSFLASADSWFSNCTLVKCTSSIAKCQPEIGQACRSMVISSLDITSNVARTSSSSIGISASKNLKKPFRLDKEVLIESTLLPSDMKP